MGQYTTVGRASPLRPLAFHCNWLTTVDLDARDETGRKCPMPGKRIEKRFVYEGFGFPVVFLNVPMIEVRGTWTPSVDYNKLTRAVVLALAHKPARLTGSEIRFVRLFFEMTLESFGKRFAPLERVRALSDELRGLEPSSSKPRQIRSRRLSGPTNAAVRATRSLYVGSSLSQTSVTWSWWTTVATTSSRGRPTRWRKTTADESSKKNTMAGRAPEKAKAALQWKAASLLLPHLVDELSLSLAFERRAVNGLERSPWAPGRTAGDYPERTGTLSGACAEGGRGMASLGCRAGMSATAEPTKSRGRKT